MHVVLVVPGGVDRGGVNKVIPALLSLIEGLAQQHRVTVVALGQEPVASVYPLLGATVVNVAPEQRGPHRLARQLARAVRAVGSQGQPDIVHGLWASVSGLAAVMAGRRYCVPSLVHVAGGELLAMTDIGYGGALGRGGRLIARGSLRADYISVATEWMRDHVVAAGHRVDEIIALGADTRWFVPTSVAPDQFRLVHVASLNRVKDQSTLLRAVALARRDLPRLTIDLLGVDTLSGEMQRLAATLELGDAARFHGYTPSRDLPGWFQGASLNIICSRHEAGPLAVLEAAACGVPTVGTRVGHIADFAALSPPAAVAVPCADPVALAAAIVATLADEALRTSLGAAAFAWSTAHDAANTVRSFDLAYRKLLAKR